MLESYGSCAGLHYLHVKPDGKPEYQTNFYEFMLQKVLKFANYAVVVLFQKLCLSASIMPKIMVARGSCASSICLGVMQKIMPAHSAEA